jgi:hypothetical protein
MFLIHGIMSIVSILGYAITMFNQFLPHTIVGLVPSLSRRCNVFLEELQS